MNEDEQRGYSRGYQAGLRRSTRELRTDADMRREKAFWDRAVLTVAPYFMSSGDWTQGDTRLTSLDQRAQLCIDFADKVTKARRKQP